MGSLAIIRSDPAALAPSAAALASMSRRRLVVGRDTARCICDAELAIAAPHDEAIVLGAFQRPSEIGESFEGARLVRRGSGGGAARVGPGTVWMQLSLTRPDALVASDASKLLNRYVRPLLRALTKLGATARYFGRDWISVDHRPAALVAFGHDSRNGCSLFEAIISARTSFALGPRASFLGKEPIVLDLDPVVVADAIVAAYGALASEVDLDSAAPLGDQPSGSGVTDEPAWTATCEEAIGTIAAGRDHAGILRLGGELMASTDAVARLEERASTAKDVGSAVDEILTAPNVALFGVRSLASIRDVLVAATR